MNDMHQARKAIPVLFADDEERMVRPLTISRLRKFVKVVAKLQEVQKEQAEKNETGVTDEQLDAMMDASSIILAKDYPDLAENREKLEDALDLETFNKIMTIAMGNNAATPNE